MWFKQIAISIPILLMCCVSPASAQSSVTGNVNSIGSVALSTAGLDGFSQFVPQSTNNRRKLDYTVFDDILNDVIVDLGPSTRIWQRKPDSAIGTRIVTGHKSPLRLEGRRVTFSVFNDEFNEGLTAYRQDLEQIATDYDITQFPRKEQLAFWFNLHNLTVIEQIAKVYPTKRPRNLNVDVNGVTTNFHDAKIMNIKGVPLSLRDIRENIVYKNWRDPNVIYGFFHGDIGSPAIQNYAYTAGRVDDMLKQNAEEFVNSLRGFRLSRSTTGQVSEIYETEGAFFFPDWQSGLRTHLLTHVNPVVKPDLLKSAELKSTYYEDMIADLAGGVRPRIRNLAAQSSNPFDDANRNISPEILRILRESDRKFQILRQRGVIGPRSGTVSIKDEETVDENEEGSLANRP